MKVGLIGCGAIGSHIAKTLRKRGITSMELTLIYDIDERKKEKLAKTLGNTSLIAGSVDEMTGSVDVIVEAASQEAVKQHAVNILKKRIDLVVMSVGALADEKLFGEVLEEVGAGARVYAPSGAICGLDGVKSALVGGVTSVVLTTTKPVKTLANSKYLKEKRVMLEDIKRKTTVFEGSAKEAASAFPKSINVSVALSLAGIGTDKTRVNVVADPEAETNTHEIRVSGAFGELTTKTTNKPFPENPKTSYLAALSAVATLKQIAEGMRVGT